MSALELAEWSLILDGEEAAAMPPPDEDDELDLLAAKFEARYGGR